MKITIFLGYVRLDVMMVVIVIIWNEKITKV